MKVLLDCQFTELSDSHKSNIDKLIEDHLGEELFLIVNGEYEELCNDIRAEYHKSIGHKNIKVWNWYPECENSDKECFHEWFIGQFMADEVWTCNADGEIEKRTETCSKEFFSLSDGGKDDIYLRQVSRSLADSVLFNEKHRVYIDLSDAVNTDFVTGIQRVCYALISNIEELLKNRSEYEVIPVYSEPGTNLVIKCRNVEGRYRKQVKITSHDIAQFTDGDYLLMPDINIMNVSTKVHFYNRLHNRGVRVYTLLHDIIPIRYPEYYSTDHVQVFTRYAEAISHFSGIIANSKATMEDYTRWIEEQGITLRDDFEMKYFHLGCDIDRANPTRLQAGESLKLIDTFSNKLTFLMVATIEPRKMHEQVLKAFEILWKKGHDINLVFVGKYGWQMEQFASYVNKHKQLNKNLFWLQGVSDEYLDKIYDASDAVIVASITEGFGLPIIEAANHGKRLILRDIPVFREVAGDAADYFDTYDETEMSDYLDKWINEYRNDSTHDLSGVECLNWREASEWFLRCAEIL